MVKICIVDAVKENKTIPGRFSFNILDNRDPGQIPMLTLTYGTRQEAINARFLVDQALADVIDLFSH